ncbi:uncharacterized protein [Henckelia pumila]|uniref:uncharacterized protein n=1 Tax=Henckelia pumila TaxID=405737 RepID=UPI003C6E0595
MASNARTASYTIEEDKILCHIKPNTLQLRNKRSLQCHVKTILRQVGRLRECIRQIEILKPSGASDEDILHRAKDLFMQDPIYNKGFKFDHVWPILKDLEKFSSDIHPSSFAPQTNVTNLDSSQSETQTPESELALAELQEENRVLYMDLSTIGDPEMREIVRIERAKLREKKKTSI